MKMQLLNKIRNITILIVIAIFAMSACRSNNATKKSTSGAISSNIRFVDSVSAAKLIVQDRMDGFFEGLSEVDIAIQMKKPISYGSPLQAVEAYKSFVQTEVSDFTEDEKRYMSEVFDTVNQRLHKLNPAVVFPKINLIKIKTNHYGEDVYYTREDGIYLPANTLKGRGIEGQANIMLHEVWHILSRYHPHLRSDIYKLIGFEPLSFTPILPDNIKKRVLTNPDGVARKYGIQLTQDILAIPLIISRHQKYDPSMPRFFDYLEFDLYAVDQNGNVLTDKSGKTTIPPAANAQFFTKIKDNTQYIIHPDEICADNFMLAVNARNTGNFSKFSKEGSTLLQDITQVLSAFKVK